MEVSGQPHAPAALDPGEGTWYPMHMSCEPQSQSRRVAKSKYSCLFSESLILFKTSHISIATSFFIGSAHCEVLWTIVTANGILLQIFVRNHDNRMASSYTIGIVHWHLNHQLDICNNAMPGLMLSICWDNIIWFILSYLISEVGIFFIVGLHICSLVFLRSSGSTFQFPLHSNVHGFWHLIKSSHETLLTYFNCSALYPSRVCLSKDSVFYLGQSALLLFKMNHSSSKYIPPFVSHHTSVVFKKQLSFFFVTLSLYSLLQFSCNGCCIFARTIFLFPYNMLLQTSFFFFFFCFLSKRLTTDWGRREIERISLLKFWAWFPLLYHHIIYISLRFHFWFHSSSLILICLAVHLCISLLHFPFLGGFLFCCIFCSLCCITFLL
jgi:hypothetical protein